MFICKITLESFSKFRFSFHTLKQVKGVAVAVKESIISLAVVASHPQVDDWRQLQGAPHCTVIIHQFFMYQCSLITTSHLTGGTVLKNLKP